MQENHYDPWGLNLVGLEQSPERQAHRFQYNGKEKTADFGLWWNDHGARTFDLQAPHWGQVDPLAGKYGWETPYGFGHSNPIRYNDLDGREPGEPCPGCPPGTLSNGMSLVENVYWSSRDAAVSGLATLGSFAGSLLSDTPVMQAAYSYDESGRHGHLSAVSEGEVGRAVFFGVLNVLAVLPGGGPAGLLAKTVGGKQAGVELAQEAVGGAHSTLRSSNGIEIRGFTGHGADRAAQRGVKTSSILDALKNPLKTGEIKLDHVGRPSQRFVGSKAEVALNPSTGKIVSTNATSSRKLNKLANK